MTHSTSPRPTTGRRLAAAAALAAALAVLAPMGAQADPQDHGNWGGNRGGNGGGNGGGQAAPAGGWAGGRSAPAPAPAPAQRPMPAAPAAQQAPVWRNSGGWPNGTQPSYRTPSRAGTNTPPQAAQPSWRSSGPASNGVSVHTPGNTPAGNGQPQGWQGQNGQAQNGQAQGWQGQRGGQGWQGQRGGQGWQDQRGGQAWQGQRGGQGWQDQRGGQGWQGQRGDQAWRGGNYRNWDHDWRRDNRYDWRGWRDYHRDTFHVGVYYAPWSGYYYHRLSVGFMLAPDFYRADYVIYDPWTYHLPAAYAPYQWVRYYDDALLVDTFTGRVVEVLYDFFW